MRASVSSSSAPSFEGDQELTCAGPRMTSGTFCPRATPGTRAAGPGSCASARLSQPLCSACGRSEPFSSTSWPSKCERSR